MFEIPKKPEAELVAVENVPDRFPVIDIDEVSYSHDDIPEPQENHIVHYLQNAGHENWSRYILLKNVAGLDYIFSLEETSTIAMYGFHFKTREYELASVNLDQEGLAELADVISAFLESVYLDKSSSMHEIYISPADATYSVKEIEECMEEILKSPQNRLSREELMHQYNGFRIFDHYHSIFNKYFQDEHYNDGSRAESRTRFFKSLLRAYLPNWEIVDNSETTHSFELTRKETAQK